MKKPFSIIIVIGIIILGLTTYFSINYFSKPKLTIIYGLTNEKIDNFNKRYDTGTVFDDTTTYISKTLKQQVTDIDLNDDISDNYYIQKYYYDKDFKEEVEFPLVLNKSTTLYAPIYPYIDAASLTFAKDTDYQTIVNFFIKWGDCSKDKNGNIESYTIWETATTEDQSEDGYVIDKKIEKKYIEFFPKTQNSDTYFKIGKKINDSGKWETRDFTFERDSYCRIGLLKTMDNAYFSSNISSWKSGPTYETYYDSKYTESYSLFCTYKVKKYASDKYIEKNAILEREGYVYGEDKELMKKAKDYYRVMYAGLQDAFTFADSVFQKIDSNYKLWK